MIAAIWGEEKSGKTSMALSFPKPIVHFDLDVGGYSRAIWRFKDTDGITSKPYPLPIAIDKLAGLQGSGPTIRFPKRVVGVKEAWQQIVMDYVEAVQSDAQTIILDSATQLWKICHKAYLQELQERQMVKNPKISENELRESLMPKEYGEPNDRMRTVIYTARSYQKHLVLTHYPTDIYASKLSGDRVEEYKTGKFKLDGFNDTEKLVELVVWVEPETKKDGNKVTVEPLAKITKCGLQGLGMGAVGMFLPSATYSGIEQLVSLTGGAS